jgi:hypothetical protein
MVNKERLEAAFVKRASAEGIGVPGVFATRFQRGAATARIVLILAFPVPTPAAAEESRALVAAAVPAELRPFVLPGTKAIEIERGDLNGDGRADVLLVLERQKVRPTDEDIEEGQRPILILVRQADGTLRVAARNDAAAYCSTCGGVMGDPFVGVQVRAGTFTVSNYGGSNWRWSADYRFDYSRRDATWQLVRVAETNLHTSAPDKAKTTIRRPPKDFGKIDFADFDPENLRGRGRRQRRNPSRARSRRFARPASRAAGVD